VIFRLLTAILFSFKLGLTKRKGVKELKKIVVLDHSGATGGIYREMLARAGFQVFYLMWPEKLLEVLARERPAALILGIRIPGYEEQPFALLQLVKQTYPNLLVVFNTDIRELWPEARAKGADFCHDKRDMNLLLEMIRRSGQKPPIQGRNIDAVVV